MLSRRVFTLGLVGQTLALPELLWAQAAVYLSEEQARTAVFPLATTFERTVVSSTPTLRAQLQTWLGDTHPSLWETQYLVVIAKREAALMGYGVIVEEIGKHQPITFMVGIQPNGKVADVVVMAYREPYGGEVRYRRFLAQYSGKTLQAALLPPRNIRNITGATLSCHSISRGVRKALALIQTLYLKEER